MQASGRGARLRFAAGDLFDWLGEDVPVVPDWGWRYEVVPDEEAEHIAWRQQHRRSVRHVVERGPHASDIVFPAAGSACIVPDEVLSAFDRVTLALGERMRSDLVALAGALHAVAAVLGEARAEFGWLRSAVARYREAR